MKKILFVCLGNICRSPSAEGVFRAKVERENRLKEFEIDSAGTADYHIGDMADKRSIEHAKNRGYDITPHRARQVSKKDFIDFDFILAMDKNNLRNLVAIAPPNAKNKIHLITDFVHDWGKMNPHQEIPDPYYGGPEGFELVLDLLEIATEAFYLTLKKV